MANNGRVARQGFLLDLRTVQYVTGANPFTVEVRKPIVRILLEDRVEYGATQLDDEAFDYPRREGRRHAA